MRCVFLHERRLAYSGTLREESCTPSHRNFVVRSNWCSEEPERMIQSLKNRFSLVLRVTLAILILGLLFRVAGWDALRVAFVETQWSWMIAVYLAAIASILVNAALLRFLMKSTGLEVGFGRVLLAKAQA